MKSEIKRKQDSIPHLQIIGVEHWLEESSNLQQEPGAIISAATHVLTSFKEYDQPFPIIGTIEKDPSNPEFSTNFESHCFEFTPFEFGSWDSYLHAFIPIKYLGTSLKANVPTKKSTTANHSYCVSGFDNVGFIRYFFVTFQPCIFSVYKLLESYELDAVSLIETTLKSLGLSSEWKALKTPNYTLIMPCIHPIHFSNMARKH